MFHIRQSILAAVCASLVSAQSTITGGLNDSNSDCPNNQVLTQQDGKSYCCPGTIFGEGNDRFCCVGAKVRFVQSSSLTEPIRGGKMLSSSTTEKDTILTCHSSSQFEVETPSFASCFPTCTGTADGNNGVSNVATSTQSCSTSIFFTNSDYSSLASAAAVSLSSGGSSGAGTVTSTSSGGSSSTGGSSSSGTSNTGSSSGSSATGSESSASSASGQSTGGAAMITSGPMLGGLAAAGGLLMAL